MSRGSIWIVAWPIEIADLDQPRRLIPFLGLLMPLYRSSWRAALPLESDGNVSFIPPKSFTLVADNFRRLTLGGSFFRRNSLKGNNVARSVPLRAS